MIVLDTTCLIYAVGDLHQHRSACLGLLDAARSGQLSARTTSQAIAEFAHVRARRRGRDDATRLARDYVALLGPLEPTLESDVIQALELWRAHPRIGTFDALIVAVAMRVGAEALVTEDAGLQGIADIPVLSAAEALQRFSR